MKRLKKEALLSNSGISFGVFVLPSRSAEIAITEHIPTNTNANRTDTAELNLNDSTKQKAKKTFTGVT